MCRQRVDVTSINHQLQLSQNLSNHHKMMSTAINRKYMLLCAQRRYSEQAHRRWEQYLYILLDKVLQYIEKTRQRYPHTIVLKVQGLILLFRRNTLYNPKLAHYGCSKVVHRQCLGLWCGLFMGCNICGNGQQTSTSLQTSTTISMKRASIQI